MSSKIRGNGSSSGADTFRSDADTKGSLLIGSTYAEFGPMKDEVKRKYIKGGTEVVLRKMKRLEEKNFMPWFENESAYIEAAMSKKWMPYTSDLDEEDKEDQRLKLTRVSDLEIDILQYLGNNPTADRYSVYAKKISAMDVCKGHTLSRESVVTKVDGRAKHVECLNFSTKHQKLMFVPLSMKCSKLQIDGRIESLMRVLEAAKETTKNLVPSDRIDTNRRPPFTIAGSYSTMIDIILIVHFKLPKCHVYDTYKVVYSYFVNVSEPLVRYVLRRCCSKCRDSIPSDPVHATGVDNVKTTTNVSSNGSSLKIVNPNSNKRNTNMIKTGSSSSTSSSNGRSNPKKFVEEDSIDASRFKEEIHDFVTSKKNVVAMKQVAIQVIDLTDMAVLPGVGKKNEDGKWSAIQYKYVLHIQEAVSRFNFLYPLEECTGLAVFQMLLYFFNTVMKPREINLLHDEANGDVPIMKTKLRDCHVKLTTITYNSKSRKFNEESLNIPEYIDLNNGITKKSQLHLKTLIIAMINYKKEPNWCTILPDVASFLNNSLYVYKDAAPVDVFLNYSSPRLSSAFDETNSEEVFKEWRKQEIHMKQGEPPSFTVATNFKRPLDVLGHKQELRKTHSPEVGASQSTRKTESRPESEQESQSDSEIDGDSESENENESASGSEEDSASDSDIVSEIESESSPEEDDSSDETYNPKRRKR